MYFTAHSQGKAAARVRSGVFPAIHDFIKQHPGGIPHYFQKKENNDTIVTGWPNELVIYHYPNCGFDQYLTKYQLLGNFPDKAYNEQRIDFHKMSRDAYVSNNFRSLMELYIRNVQLSDPEALKELLNAGIIEENKNIAKLIINLLNEKPRRAAA
jgi:hypothetical protein